MRRHPLVYLVLIVLALGGTALACGDDKSSSTASDPLDAYFADLGEIGNDFLDSIVVQPEGLDTSAPIAEQVDVYETYANGLKRQIERARGQLLDLDPPAEAADAHAALLVSVENSLSVAEALEEQIGDINSSEDLLLLSNNQEILAALAGFRTACLALKDIATENDIQREVRCE